MRFTCTLLLLFFCAGLSLLHGRKITVSVENNPYLTEANKLYDEGKLDSAIIYLRQAIDLARTENDSLGMVESYYTMGCAYVDMNSREEALEYLAEAAKIAGAREDYEMAFRCNNTWAASYNNLQKPLQAMPIAEQALKYAMLSGNKFYMGNAWCTVATSYYLMAKYDDAIGAYSKGMEYYQEINNLEMYNMIRNMVAFILNDTGRKDEAVALLEAPEAAENFTYRPDTLKLGSFQEMQIRLLNSSYNAVDKKLKFDIIQREYLEQQAKSLRQRIWFISLLSGLIIILLLLLYNRQRQKAKAESAARYAEEKEKEYISLQKDTDLRLIRKYIDGLESERSRISKELHDGICNDLLALEMELKEGGKETEKQAAFLHQARENIRNVSHELMPPAFQYATIDEILSDYIEHLPTPEGTEIDYTQTEGGEWSSIPQNAAFEIYRITQEALGNSIKHAGANKINVSLTLENEKLILEIRDNGIGFDKTGKSRGAGLNTIYERVESIGGKLHIDSDNGGTVVKAIFNI